ncbi:MAG: oligosaccharide flippase family protein [Clostridia bacterium]|nr:oligosaccharide flippase family protein [Clostridia bacterium]
MKGFFKTVAVITLFAVCEKFLGFLYRIYLSRTIGAEGVGLYSVALSVFGLIFTVVSSGVPITVSRFMAKYHAEGSKEKEQKIISAGLFLTLVFSLPVVATVFIFRNNLGFMFADERVTTVFVILIFGLTFTSLYSVLRGVFWGNKDFLPYSVIELLEEICMIVVGVILISGSNDAFGGATRAAIAVFFSFVFSFTLATVTFFIRKNKLKDPRSQLKPLIKSSAPVTAMRTANSLIVSLVSVILPARLIASGYAQSKAMSLFGAAVGQAIPVLFIPSTLIGAFTVVLVPELSENFYRGRHDLVKKDIEKAVKFTCLICAVFTPLFLTAGKEIGFTVFGNTESGNFIAASGITTLFMGVSTVTTSVLNSIGKENQTLIYYIAGTLLMLLCVWVLPPVMGIYSLTVGYACVYVLTTILNVRLINKTCNQKPAFTWFSLSCLMISGACGVFGLLLKGVLSKFTDGIIAAALSGVLSTAATIICFAVFGLVSIATVISVIKKPSKRTAKKSKIIKQA